MHGNYKIYSVEQNPDTLKQLTISAQQSLWGLSNMMGKVEVAQKILYKRGDMN